MKLTHINTNCTQVDFSNGVSVLFSYSTPVAAYTPDKGYIVTTQKYSQTTTKHISQWLHHVVHSQPVPQDVLDNLIGGI